MNANENLTKEARRRYFRGTVDISAANVQATMMVDTLNALIIRAISFVYHVATDAGTTPENIQVGTPASAALYFTGAPSASKALGFVEAKAVASAAQLPAGTPLVINKAAATGGTNTGEVTVVVAFEIVDKDRSGGV